MKAILRKNRALVPLFLTAVALLAALAGRAGYVQAVDQLARRGASDMALAADSLTSQLKTYQELAVLMADHPVLEDLATAEARDRARVVLRRVADKTSALDLALVDTDGRVVVAASGEAGSTTSGAFERAMHGAIGDAHGPMTTKAERVWSYAAPVFGPDHKVRGAMMVTADVDRLEEAWRGGPAPVYFVDNAGVVFISNRSELLFWRALEDGPGLRPPGGTADPVPVGRAKGYDIWRIGWSPYVPRTAVHLEQEMPVIGMTANMLVDLAPARRLGMTQAAAVAAICLAFGMMLYLTVERRRTLALANAKLETRVAARTRALTQANIRLRREVAEREEAEAALKRAQDELIQAGKLSALGQMSAGISHELNQPLMAIRQFAENGAAFLDRDRPQMARDNLNRISTLAQRAARIIKNLRAFARNEHEPMSKVDLVQVIDAAVELTEGRLTRDDVVLRWDRPEDPAHVWGGETRLVQVFVNLINNAADAMMAQEDRAIEIGLHPGERLSVTVRDMGPGIADPDRIFEPFYSTKEVGSDEGMGLGLSISYGLVQSFGGDIRGMNAEGGGAVFSVELDPWSADKEQAA